MVREANQSGVKFFLSAFVLLSFSFCLLSCAPVPLSEEEIIQQAIDKVFPALVFIKPIQEEFSGGKAMKQQIFGSGVIISPDGYVVTNNHVAEKSTRITCVLYNKEEISAEVVGLDPETDLAVLKLNLSELKDKKPIPVAHFGDSGKLKTGERALAMGSPLGFTRSVSSGVVSSTERFFEFSPYTLWLQTDAAINPGNSGGPLVNASGEVIGINSLTIRGAENMGFAIPSSVVQDVVGQLIANKKVTRAWTGIRFQPLKDYNKDATFGALVAGVDEGSPAVKAEIHAGTIILSCNGIDTNGVEPTDLPAVERFFASLPSDVPARLAIQERDKVRTVMITPVLKGKFEGEDFDAKKWNLTVKEITKFADPDIFFYKDKGVYVQGIKYGGNAVTSGLLRNDIVMDVAGEAVDTLAKFAELYKKLEVRERGKRKVVFRVLRNGYPRLVVLDFEKDIEKIEEGE